VISIVNLWACVHAWHIFADLWIFDGWHLCDNRCFFNDASNVSTPQNLCQHFTTSTARQDIIKSLMHKDELTAESSPHRPLLCSHKIETTTNVTSRLHTNTSHSSCISSLCNSHRFLQYNLNYVKAVIHQHIYEIVSNRPTSHRRCIPWWQTRVPLLLQVHLAPGV